MKMEQEQMDLLRRFFLRELPEYVEKRLDEIIDKEELEQYIKEHEQKTGVLVRDTGKGYCRSISQILYIILKLYGFENVWLADISIMLGNKKAQEIFKREGVEGIRKVIREKSDPKVYTLGAGLTSDPQDFHTALRIGDTILDMSASQMKRLDKGIIINNYWTNFDKLGKKFKCILYMEAKEQDHNFKSLIMTHPDIIGVLKYVSDNIAKILKLRPKYVSKIES